MLSRAWRLRCLLTCCQRLCLRRLSPWQHTLFVCYRLRDHRLRLCWRSADSSKLAHTIYGHLKLSKLNLFVLLCSWNASERLIIFVPAKKWPVLISDSEYAVYPLRSATSSLCLMCFQFVTLTCLQLLIRSCVVPTPYTLTYSTVLLLSPSLCMHPLRYAVTYPIWQMSAQNKNFSDLHVHTHTHTITSLKCTPHPPHV